MKAKQIMDKYWDLNIPVNPVQIAQAMGIKVISESNLGYIAITTSDSIRYSNRESLMRQRFAVAHALGNIILGNCSTEILYTAQSYSKENYLKRDANTFAKEMLVPIHICNLQ